MRENLKDDFSLDKSDGLPAKAEIGKILLAWHEARFSSEEESKARAEAKANHNLHVIENPSD